MGNVGATDTAFEIGSVGIGTSTGVGIDIGTGYSVGGSTW